MFVCACVLYVCFHTSVNLRGVCLYVCVCVCVCSSRYPPVEPRAPLAKAGTEASCSVFLRQEAAVLRSSEPPPGRNTYLERLNTLDTMFMSDTLIKSNIQIVLHLVRTVDNKGSEVHKSSSISVGRAKGLYFTI